MEIQEADIHKMQAALGVVEDPLQQWGECKAQAYRHTGKRTVLCHNQE